jgi:hypothetical protein
MTAEGTTTTYTNVVPSRTVTPFALIHSETPSHEASRRQDNPLYAERWHNSKP